jgi:2-amino-4-hydroxy-6-hydroxymethyldihydropteridine diphosphokinase
MSVAYIGLGSNIDPEIHIPMALERLRQKLSFIKVSTFYRIPAMGTALGQGDFINGMVAVETNLTAHQLKFSVLREIEYELGRNKEMPKHAARKMDLDLIIFDQEIIEELNVPEPQVLERPYVYLPLLDLNPTIVIPGHEKPLMDMVTAEVAFARAEI